MTDLGARLRANGLTLLEETEAGWVIARSGTDLVALTREGRSELWRHPLGTDRPGGVCADAHTILWSDRERRLLIALAATDGRRLYTLDGEYAFMLAGDRFLASNGAGAALLHRTESGDLIGALPGCRSDGPCVLSPDRRWFAAGDHPVQLWDLNEARLHHSFEAGIGAQVAFTPDSAALIVTTSLTPQSGMEDEITRRTYDLRTGALVDEHHSWERQGPQALADQAPSSRPPEAMDDRLPSAPAAAQADGEQRDCPTCTEFQGVADAANPFRFSLQDGEAEPAFLGRLETLSTDGDWDLVRCQDCGRRYRCRKSYEYDAYAPSYWNYDLYRIGDDPADPPRAAVAPAPATPAALPAPPAPPPAPPPTRDELLRRPVPDLEAELRRVIAGARIPPSAVRQLFEAHESNAGIPDAERRDQAQRTFLANAIVAHREPDMQLRPGEATPSTDLVQVFLSTPFREGSPVNTWVLERQKAIGILLNEYEQGPYPAEDRDFFRRRALAALIRENAADPSVLQSPGAR